MNKAELRKYYKNERNDLSLDDRELAAHSIAEKVNDNWSFENKTISVFLPIERLLEVDTTTLIKTLKKKNVLCAPVSDLETHEMEHYTFTDDSLVRNEWDIPEPKNGRHVPPEDIDVVLVPLLISDIFGHRLGYGKGFYDRFLSRCNTQTLFVGLNYFEPIPQLPDVGIHDKSLHYLVTPTLIFKSELPKTPR